MYNLSTLCMQSIDSISEHIHVHWTMSHDIDADAYECWWFGFVHDSHYVIYSYTA